MWAEEEQATVYGSGARSFPVLIDPAVDGITADVYIEQCPSPVRLGQGLTVRGKIWLVAVVREWVNTGTRLAVSWCNKTGVLYRREAAPSGFGHTYQVTERVPVIGVWRIMSTSEKPDQVMTAGNFMPVGGWDWPGTVHDVLRLDDGSWWEQYGPVMSDRTALSMVLSGTAVVQFRQIPELTGDEYGEP